MVEVTKRGPLAGVLGTAVIATNVAGLTPSEVKPSTELPALDPWRITAPPGWTYQWVRCALMGVPDPANVQKRLDNGWQFVVPKAHPGAPVSTVAEAVESDGLILMEKPTAQVKSYTELLREKQGDMNASFGRVQAARQRVQDRRDGVVRVEQAKPAIPEFKFPEVIFEDDA